MRAECVAVADPCRSKLIGIYVNLKLWMPRPGEVSPGIRNYSAMSVRHRKRRIALTPILDDPARQAVHAGASRATPNVWWIAIVQLFFPDRLSDRTGWPFFRGEHPGAASEGDVEEPTTALACHLNQGGFIRVNVGDPAWMEIAIARHRVFIEPNRLLRHPGKNILITSVQSHLLRLRQSRFQNERHQKSSSH